MAATNNSDYQKVVDPVVKKFIENYRYTQESSLYDYTPWASTPESCAEQFFEALAGLESGTDIDVNKEIREIAANLRMGLPKYEAKITKLFKEVHPPVSRRLASREKYLSKEIAKKMEHLAQMQTEYADLLRYEQETPKEKIEEKFQAFFRFPDQDYGAKIALEKMLPKESLEAFKANFESVATKIQAILNGREEIQKVFKNEERFRALALFENMSKNGRNFKPLLAYEVRKGRALFDFLLNNYYLSRGFSDYTGDQRTLGRFFEKVLSMPNNPLKAGDLFG